MKATEFCKFFDFTLEKCDIDEYGDECGYKATDDQGVFYTRYVMDVKDLSDGFDSMLQDYIENDIEANGFDFDPTCDKQTYYEQALTWCDNNEIWKNTDTREIIACLVNPDLIEDDLED